MVDNRVFVLSFISVALLAAAIPTAHAAATSGQLCCTSTGNCPGQGVGGAVVQLNCIVDRRIRTFSRATTNSTGGFTITRAPSMKESLCGLVVDTPLRSGGCGELAGGGKCILLANFQPDGSLTAFKKFAT